jgi:CubicO group peptidase (beta-lactamase class C family)
MSVGFGLGWEVLDYGNNKVIRHTGSDWGEKAIGYFVPTRGVGVVIFTNGANGSKVIRDISALLYDHPAFNALLQLQAQ